MPDPPIRRAEIRPSHGPPGQIDSEPEILRKLLNQFDAQHIRTELADSRIYRYDDLVTGDQALHELMRCIQTSDLDFRDRSLNEIVEQALAI